MFSISRFQNCLGLFVNEQVRWFVVWDLDSLFGCAFQISLFLATKCHQEQKCSFWQGKLASKPRLLQWFDEPVFCSSGNRSDLYRDVSENCKCWFHIVFKKLRNLWCFGKNIWIAKHVTFNTKSHKTYETWWNVVKLSFELPTPQNVKMSKTKNSHYEYQIPYNNAKLLNNTWISSIWRYQIWKIDNCSYTIRTKMDHGIL